MSNPSLVVITPVKNEEWILPRFLETTTRWADLIIIADQYSTDESVRICKRYDKVVVIPNKSTTYDEAERQHLLIREARDRVPGARILLALDADEILAADSTLSPGWKTMLGAAPGTVLYFEKPDLTPDPEHCIRYRDNYWPIGFVDDGSEHAPKRVHSIRIPRPPGATHLKIEGVRFLHYGTLGFKAQRAKRRFYSIQEVLNGAIPLFRRRLNYAAPPEVQLQSPEPCDAAWFTQWEEKGIEMRSYTERDYYWHDREVLELLQRHGSRRFWLEPIWDFNWRACQVAFSEAEKKCHQAAVKAPPKALLLMMRLYDCVVRGVVKAKRMIVKA